MNKYFSINGGNKLSGKIRISGAKNSVLPLIIASIMTDDVVTFEDVPEIKDVKEVLKILKSLNSNVISSKQGAKKYLTIDNSETKYSDLLMKEITKFRASYYFMGAFIAKYKKCKLLLPGGCYLGPRPIDLHIMGLEKLGCVIKTIDGENQEMEITCPDGLKGTEIFLDIPSVGATINLMLAAAMAEGETKIDNAAKEPEIIDVATLLNNMGANIKGAGTGEIRITGVKKLDGCLHQVVPDRIEAGTYVLMGAMLGQDLSIENIIPEHLEGLTSKLQVMGVDLDVGEDKIHIKSSNVENLKPGNIKTGVFPSFPTDLQQIFLTLQTQANGESKITETIYPERFKQCEYLAEMGANIELNIGSELSTSLVKGKTPLKGAKVVATDLRAGAALVFAGLIAKGNTRVYEIDHILRGYEDLVGKLENVGADITLVEENNE